jgi:hypothetical protein
LPCGPGVPTGHDLYDIFLNPEYALRAGRLEELIVPLQHIPEVVHIKVYNRDGTIQYVVDYVELR